ncbi:hypothetical protein IAD21_03899 [Abditibacteriota bacterium]|nr:hypothetical protein IAD21_03899 [Abditibacteriota bacterium]
MKILPVLLSTLALVSIVSAQTPAQQKAARTVFERFRMLNQTKKLNTPPARAIVTGEAIAYTSNTQLGPISKPDAFVFPDATHAVTRVQGLSEKGAPIIDVYFYLTRSGSNWKLSALRTLALTGITGMVRDQLERKPKLSPKERDELANIHLLLSLDADLRAHFQRNQAAFARLATSERQPLSSTELTKLKRQLAFDPSPSASEHGDGLEWIIGGTLDNTVGYGYSKSGQLPPISPNEIIWAERLSPHWYLFRTT